MNDGILMSTGVLALSAKSRYNEAALSLALVTSGMYLVSFAQGLAST
jgi:hypothetical protein